MPKARVSIAILLALVTMMAPVAFAAHRVATASFVPPAEAGVIFTVINYDHAFGRTQGTVVNVDWGAASRRITVAPPYRTCAETPAAGIVLKLRHPRPDSVPLTITTTGTIVRGPYQGDPPLELLSACYRLAS